MKNTEILNTALNIIVNEGIEKLSMRKLANEVGCTPSTLYHYFTDKNDLLNKLVLYVDQKVDENYFDRDVELREVIAQMFSTDKEYLLYQKFLRSNWNANFITDETREIISKRIDERKKIWVNFRENEIIRDDVDKKTMHILFWGVSQMIAQDDTVDEKTRENLTEVIYRGISGHNIGFEGEDRKKLRRRMRVHKRTNSRRTCRNKRGAWKN